MGLILNDFRNVLGKVNDGNVVFTQNEQGENTGIKKVNYGRVFTKESTPNDPVVNRQIRQAFFNAISNSAEGKLASQEFMENLRTRLGLGPQDDEVGNMPLTRREIKQVLSIFDGANAGGIEGVDNVVDREIAALRKAGVYNAETGKAIRNLLDPGKDGSMALFRDAESMKAAFGKKENFNGFSRTQLNRFIEENCNRLRLMAFDRLYWDQADAEKAEAEQGFIVLGKPTNAAGKPDFQRNLLRTLADQLMGAYGRHEELSSRGLDFVTCEPAAGAGRPVDGLEGPVDDFNALADMIFTDDDSAFDNAQNAVLRDTAKNVFASAYREIARQQNGSQVERLEGSRTEFAKQHPEMAKALDLPFDALRGLGEWERKMLGAKLRGAVLAELKAAGNLPVSADAVLGAVLSAVKSLEVLQSDRMTTSLLTTLNDNKRSNLDENQLKEIAKGCGDLVRSEGFKHVQQAMAANVALGRPINAGLAGTADFDTLVQALGGKIDAAVEGPEVRLEMFKAMGKTSAALYKLPDSMRKPDENGPDGLKQSPADDRAALIGAKCAFLEIMLGQGHPDLKGVIGPGFTFIEGDDPETGMTEEDRIKKLDALVERFSADDVGSTKAYLEKELSVADGTGTFYKLFRDKRIGVSDLNAQGCQNFALLKGNGIFSHLPVLQLLQAKTTDENELRAVHNMFSAMFTGSLSGDYRAPAYENRDSLNAHWAVLNMGAGDGAQKIGAVLLGKADAFRSLPDSELIGAMADFGIGVNDLDTLAGAARMVLLMRARVVHGNSFAGLADWLERVSGIDVRTATLDQLATLAAAVENADKAGEAADPLRDGKIPAGDKNTIAFLEGKIKIEEFALDKASMGSLLAAARSLANAKALAEPVVKECVVGGTKVKLSVGADGAFRVRIVLNGRELPVTTSRSAADLRDALETRVANHPGEYGELAAGVLPTLAEGKPVGCTVTRARELCVKTIVAKLGASPMAFAAMGLEELVACARGALAGTYTLADVPKDPPAVYNSADVVAMQQAYAEASEDVRALVKLPNDVGVRSLEERRNNPPSDKTVHALISELVMNLDTAVYDRDAAKAKGVRLQTVLNSYAPELAFVRGDLDKYVATLPETVRGGVKTLLEKIFAADVDDLGALATIEDDIAKFVTDTMNDMQAKIAALFDKPVEAGGEQGEAWTRSLEELANVNGLDPKSPNGKFVLDVLKNYFKSADDTEKRAMLSAFLRNTFVTTNEHGETKEPSIGKQAGELMKGAGPVFQKMLQGLPIESFSPETQAALRDMKSRLAPIPEPVVKAQLLNLIQSSNGNLLSIEVKKTLGCATVGQALLCHVKTKEHPYTGEDVVIKLLRPNVQTAALREFKVISQIAEASGGAGMVKTFEGQFQTILRELDFTLEAENIDVGKVHYDRPTVNGESMAGVRSMGRSTTVPAATNALVLEKVSGDTLDGTLTKCADKIKGIKAQFERKIALDENAEPRTVLQGKTLGDVERVRGEMLKQIELLAKKRGQLENLLKTWLNEALFGSGFFHGDMHAGNVMSDDKAMTFIDFGNAIRLSEAEQTGLAKLFVTAGYNNEVDKPAGTFLDALANLLDADGKNALAAERNAIERELAEVMKLGTSDRLISKVFAALAVVQRHKVSLPEGVNAFVQSLSRLKGAMSQIDDLIEQSETVFETIEHGPDVVSSLNLGEFRGRIPMIDEFLAVVETGGKNAEKGLPNDANKANVKKLGDYFNAVREAYSAANSAGTALTAFPGAEYADMKPFGENGDDFSLFEELAKRFKGLLFTTSGAGNPPEELTGVQSILENVAKAKALAAKPDKTENDVRNLARAKNVMVSSAMNLLYMAARAVGTADPIPREERPTFEEVVGRCLSDNIDVIQTRLGKIVCMNFAYGSLMVDGHVIEEREKAETKAVEANRALGEADRIGELRQQKLLRVLKEFRFPNGPASNGELDFDTAVRALAVNLEVARKRLGRAKGERMTEGELAFMANYLKNLHQAYDDRNAFMRGLTLTAAFGSMLANGTAPTEAYSVNVKNLNPVMRAVGNGQALPENADPDLARLVELMRAPEAQA